MTQQHKIQWLEDNEVKFETFFDAARIPSTEPLLFLLPPEMTDADFAHACDELRKLFGDQKILIARMGDLKVFALSEVL